MDIDKMDIVFFAVLVDYYQIMIRECTLSIIQLNEDHTTS